MGRDVWETTAADLLEIMACEGVARDRLGLYVANNVLGARHASAIPFAHDAACAVSGAAISARCSARTPRTKRIHFTVPRTRLDYVRLRTRSAGASQSFGKVTACAATCGSLGD